MNNKYYTSLSIITSIIIILSLGSCQDIDPNQELVGEWTMSSIITNQEVESENSFAKARKEIATTTNLTFNADKTFFGKIWGDTTYGIWNIEQNGTILNIFDEQSNYKITTKLTFESKTKISLVEKQDSMSVKMDFIKTIIN